MKISITIEADDSLAGALFDALTSLKKMLTEGAVPSDKKKDTAKAHGSSNFASDRKSLNQRAARLSISRPFDFPVRRKREGNWRVNREPRLKSAIASLRKPTRQNLAGSSG